MSVNITMAGQHIDPMSASNVPTGSMPTCIMLLSGGSHNGGNRTMATHRARAHPP